MTQGGACLYAPRMGDFFSDLFHFAITILSYWQAYLTGGFITGVIGLVERLSHYRLTRRGYVGVFVVSFLLVSFFSAWRDEHRSVEEAHKKIVDLETQFKNDREKADKKNSDLEEQFKKTTPHLQGRIASYVTGVYDPERLPIVGLFTIVSNTGIPSVAEGWRLDVQTKEVTQSFKASLFMKNFPIPASGSSPAIVIRPQDMIYEKATNPIPTGGTIRGWLIFALHGLEPSQLQPNTKLTLRFRDVLGQESSTSLELEEGMPGGWYIPGAGMSLPAPTKRVP